MELRETTEGDVLVLAPEGNLVDTEDTSAIDTRLAAALKAKVVRVVIDCAGVGLVSSSAIRILLMTMRKLERVQGRLVLCSLSAKVISAFAISGFDKDFTVAGTRDEAFVRVREVVATQQPRKTKRAPVAEASAPPVAAIPPTPAADAAPPVATPPAPPVAEPQPVPKVAVQPPAAVAPTPAAAPPAADAPPAPAQENPKVQAPVAPPQPDADELAATLLRALAVPGVVNRGRGTPVPDAEMLAAGILGALGTQRGSSRAG